jgi:hypothetical protein
MNLGIGLSLTSAGVPQAFAELNMLSATLDPRITFTRASTKTYVGSDGLLHTAAVNECPLEYDPVTLLPVGRSFWEARTNLLLNSGTPATQGVTVTAQSYTLSFTGPGSVALSGAYAGSLSGTGTGPANRVSLTFTPTAGTLTVTPSGSVQNFQIEAGASASPYIPTTSAAVTRAADVAAVNTLSTLRFNAAAGTLYIEFASLHALDTSSNVSVVSLNDGTSNNRMQIRAKSNAIAGVLVAGAGDASRTVSGTYATGQALKVALAFSSAGSSEAANGVLNTAAVTVAPLAANKLQICTGTGDTVSTQASALIKRIRYYPMRLADAQLQVMTA